MFGHTGIDFNNVKVMKAHDIHPPPTHEIANLLFIDDVQKRLERDPSKKPR